MNDTELEECLRRLEPVAPGAQLEVRIAAALAAPAHGAIAGGVLRQRGPRALPSWWPKLAWSALGAAVGSLAVLAYFGAHPQATTAAAAAAAPASVFVAQDSDREVVASEEAGTLYDGENLPSKLMRYSSIERRTWTNPTTGASVEVEMPREDVVLVPVSYQ